MSHDLVMRIARGNLRLELHTRSGNLTTHHRYSFGESVRYSGAHALRILAATVLVMLALNTSAAENKVEVQLLAEVKVSSPGPDNKPIAHFAPAGTLSQGEIVYYSVRIRNPTAEYLRDVVVVQPIPANTTYVERSASGPGTDIQFSADGGQTFAPEGRVTFTDLSGVQHAATAKDYTHVRWQLRNALAPAATALARFQAVFR